MDNYTELRKAIEAATPGPWEEDQDDNGFYVQPFGRPDLQVAISFSEVNGTYIAAANPAVIKQLLADYDRLCIELANALREGEDFKEAFEQLTTDAVALAMRKRGSDERSIGAHQAANEIIDKAAELSGSIRRARAEIGEG